MSGPEIALWVIVGLILAPFAFVALVWLLNLLVTIVVLFCVFTWNLVRRSQGWRL